MVQKVTSNTGTVAGNQQQQGQCVQVSQAMIGSQPTAQIISPLQVFNCFILTNWCSELFICFIFFLNFIIIF